MAFDFAALEQRLVARARALAEARALARTLRRPADRWRDARLLWPLFAKD
ncbi:hypothetical protein [Novosphingobium huizhouense]|nr:hypothetical protein [Novosphingobium huizhouense]